MAVAGLIAIGVQLYRNWDTMKERFEIAFSAFQPLIETTKAAFQNLLDSLNPIWDSLKQLFESILPILTAVGVIVVSVVVSAFGLAISIFNATVSAIGPLINAFVNMVDFVVNVFMVIISIITLDFASALEYWERATENAIQFFLSLWDGS
ncbi:hypothetical protein [Thalassobacillus sp. C254]|uniref:hypothetical protein n=1 Tax=Thalassobacillus sp. C254 TaxID=1225341 RepID=UPI0012ED8615|nr:hypothetical protein [Thalassobacillus sp. C254]